MVINPKINEIRLTPLIGLDLETTGLFPWLGAKIDLLALANELGDTYVLEVGKYPISEIKGLFQQLLLSKCIGHNIKFDCNFILQEHGICLRNIFCTQIGAQIVDNGRQKEFRFNLIEVIKRYLGGGYGIEKEEKKALQQSFVSAGNNPVHPIIRTKQIAYAAEDVALLIPLYKVLIDIVEERGLITICDLEHKVLPVLSLMEIRGTKIDQELWRSLIKVWTVELQKIEDLLDQEAIKILNGKKSKFKFNRRRCETETVDLFGHISKHASSSSACVNYAGPEQVMELWREFGEEPPKDHEDKFTVGEGAVETYVTENPNTVLTEFIRLLLEYRGLSKLLSTYGETLLEVLDKEGCIHTSYTQTRTETGRLSSKEPNLQNIPSKGIGKALRNCFIPRPGFKMITCDMAGAEVAIAADYSKEPLLLDALKNGADMHSKLASVSFSIIFKQPIVVSKSKETIEVDGHSYVLNDLRDEHKSVVFAKFYKAGAKRVYGVLAEYINRHHSASNRLHIAEEISNALDDTMPTLSQYLSALITQAKNTGYLVSDKLGRIRYFKPTVYGEAANYPIQGTNANALKIALIKVQRYLEDTGYGFILMNIHDELVCEALEDKAEEVAAKIKELVSESLSYFLTDIKGGASCSIGYTWAK